MSRRSRSRSRGQEDDLSESQGRERIDAGTARLSVEFQIRRQEYEDEIKLRKSQSQAPVAPPAPVESKQEKKDNNKKKNKDDKKNKPKFDAPNWHQTDIPQVMATFELDSVDLGLKSDFAAQRLIEKGPNVIKPPRPSIIWKLLGYVFGGFNILLLGSAVLAIIAWRIGTPPDPNNLGLAIILVVVAAISGGFNWYQEHKSSKVMDTIKKLLPTEVHVVRDGAEKLLPASELVVGDVVVLHNGDRVPADLRLVDVRSLRIDQAALTGESEPVSSSSSCTDSNYLQTRNIAFCGTNIVEGSGRGIVVSTGNNTVMGSIASAASASSERSSGLQLEIRRVVIVIAILAAITATAVILSWVFWLNPSKPNFMNLPTMLATVIGIMVAFLPDGLPFCIVLALTLVAKQMALNSVVVKHLPTVETLGTVDVLASDKTGTLTQNKMSVVHVFTLPSNLLDVSQSHKIVDKHSDTSQQARKLVLLSALCSGAKFEAHEEAGDVINVGNIDDDFAENAKILGDASDTAIMRFAAHNSSVEITRKKWPKLFDIPFNSKNKWMLTIHAIPLSSASLEASEESTKVRQSKKELYDGENAEIASAHLKHKALLIMKGAGEIILSKCSRFMDQDGSIKPLTDKERRKIAKQQEKLGSHGERVLGFGYSEFTVDKRFPLFSKAFDEDRERFDIPAASQALIFVGLVALMDPPRPEVPPAIQRLRRAGVRVMMVTGDHSTTALAIARKVGIVTAEDVDLVTKDTVWDLINDQNARGLIASSVYHHDKRKALRATTPEQQELSVTVDDSEGLPQRAIAITGADMGVFDDKAWDWVIAHDEIVFARTTPEDKLRIVTELQRRKHVVSMTGDGVNDAPALRQAEAGVAMGAGSDVAKEAADVILTDNNFSSILVAIEYGRLVFDNLTKVLLYLFPSGSFCEIVPVILNVWLGVPLPLSAFLMIYLACFTDVGPALALIKEKSEGNLMLRAPRRKDQHLVSAKTFAHAYGYLGIIEALGAHIMYFWYMVEYARLGPSHLFLAFDSFNQDNFGGSGFTAAELQLHLRAAQTVYFVTVVVMQFGNMLATRTQFLSFFNFNPFRGAGQNISMFIAMAVSIVLAVLIVYVPPFNDIFGTRPIPFQFWFLPVIFSVAVFVADEIRKLFVRRYFSSSIAKEMEMK